MGMICLSDLSPLMQRTIAKGISFMVSQSGIKGVYNLSFTQYVLGIGYRSVRFHYHQDEKQIIQYADGEHGIKKFDDINDVLEFAIMELMK
jgi:hypothetical protein